MNGRRSCAHVVRAGTLAFALTFSGCHTSPAPRTYAARDAARGATITIDLSGGGQRVGELLAVTDSSVTILTSNRVAVGAFRDTRSFSYDKVSWHSFDLSDPRVLATCRARSRFPLGITTAAMQALLVASGQATPDALAGDRR